MQSTTSEKSISIFLIMSAKSGSLVFLKIVEVVKNLSDSVSLCDF